MNELPPRFRPIFLEVFESLPRQGPGNRTCAAKALALCSDLPPSPVVLDLGCGVGGQTFHLAELTSGTIVAVDSYAPSIERLRATVDMRGLAVLDQLAREPEMHHKYSDFYAYEFFVAFSASS
jgi:cyclopropane fatty-acyl-phospholipid synthase-like methyltransferase